MACHTFGAKPLYKAMLGYCQMDPWEQTSMKLESKYKTYCLWKCICKYRLRNGSHFVQEGWGGGGGVGVGGGGWVGGWGGGGGGGVIGDSKSGPC